MMSIVPAIMNLEVEVEVNTWGDVSQSVALLFSPVGGEVTYGPKQWGVYTT